jgi:hypothetical protein
MSAPSLFLQRKGATPKTDEQSLFLKAKYIPPKNFNTALFYAFGLQTVTLLSAY